MKHPTPVTNDRTTWPVGLRVSRQDGAELGTVVRVNGRAVKVRWDSGQTSYYRHGEEANVRLIEPPE